MNNLNEKELIEKAEEDPKAFAILYDKYYNAILSYAYHRTLDMELAKDITSETFLKAFNSISRFTWRDISASNKATAYTMDEGKLLMIPYGK